MNTEPASVLHRFVSLANEPDYLALGWMRERPCKPPVQNFGVWLIWPCITCLPVEPHSGAVCGGWWPRCPPLPTHEHGIVFGRNDPVAKCRDVGPIGEIAADEAEGSPASMPPTSGAGAGVGDRRA
jgi:hypothetical protein